MNIGLVAIIFEIVFLASCAPSNEMSVAAKGIVYKIGDLTSLQICQFHQDCPANSNQSCIELTSANERRCYTVGDEGHYVACSKGEVIMLSGDPEQFACY